MRTLLISLAIACLSACSFVGFPGVYKIDVEQGNIITQEMADQLQPGMSRRQVRFILGTPLVEDSFNQDRWDYPYVKRNGQNVLFESRLTVMFEGDELTDVTGDYLPPAWQDPESEATEGQVNPDVDADADTSADSSESEPETESEPESETDAG